ncbi:MAG: DUF3795 domain-containing protein [Acidobacteria bacterium]|nr:DUF3795 domain-containing protein [Acidobacteriota bacterium]
MDNREIACCGIVCSECGAFQATKASDRKKAQATADQWTREYHVSVKVADVWCDGCMALGDKCVHARECQIRECGLGRRIPHCAACAEYPCAKLDAFHGMVPQARKTLDALRVVRP